MTLSKNLVEWPGVAKTAIPHLIDRLDGISITLALRSTPHRLHRPPPHTILMLVRKLPYPISEEFVRPSALSAQGTGTDLSTPERALVSNLRNPSPRPPTSHDSKLDLTRCVQTGVISPPYRPRPSDRLPSRPS